MKRKFLFRIISVIELIFMIFTIAPVISFAQEEMPQDLTAVYEDDFSDGEISRIRKQKHLRFGISKP